eukprot:6483145-Amphidinium_carterae.1
MSCSLCEPGSIGRYTHHTVPTCRLQSINNLCRQTTLKGHSGNQNGRSIRLRSRFRFGIEHKGLRRKTNR